MKYAKILDGVFLKRPNRFIAYIEIAGREEICHVKNTGRCKELLIPGCKVYVEESSNPLRKTKYDLIAVKKGATLINMDSQAPNKVALEWLENGGIKGITFIKPESTYGNSRFDFYFEKGKKKCYLEVKGVTLEDNGVVRFPDAPTERGVKHINELISATKDGFETYILFVIQMKCAKYFEPNWTTQPAFGDSLIAAKKAGVKLLAYTCTVTKSTLKIDHPVKIRLNK